MQSCRLQGTWELHELHARFWRDWICHMEKILGKSWATLRQLEISSQSVKILVNIILCEFPALTMFCNQGWFLELRHSCFEFEYVCTSSSFCSWLRVWDSRASTISVTPWHTWLKSAFSLGPLTTIHYDGTVKALLGISTTFGTPLWNHQIPTFHRPPNAFFGISAYTKSGHTLHFWTSTIYGRHISQST